MQCRTYSAEYKMSMINEYLSRDISIRTLSRWMSFRHTIREALAYGDELLKADLMSALKKRAVGYMSTTKTRLMQREGGRER
ncbi:MAG: hypothetical protein MR775_00785 [Erysipelotrichaceae bacterium]|nr:hypothetical protein [Erysipelotrichaceae bacterium]